MGEDFFFIKNILNKLTHSTDTPAFVLFEKFDNYHGKFSYAALMILGIRKRIFQNPDFISQFHFK